MVPPAVMKVVPVSMLRMPEVVELERRLASEMSAATLRMPPLRETALGETLLEAGDVAGGGFDGELAAGVDGDVAGADQRTHGVDDQFAGVDGGAAGVGSGDVELEGTGADFGQGAGAGEGGAAGGARWGRRYSGAAEGGFAVEGEAPPLRMKWGPKGWEVVAPKLTCAGRGGCGALRPRA